jgi:carbamoylphosphate synthase large subunit
MGSRIAVTGALSRPGIEVMRDVGRGGMGVVGLCGLAPPLNLHSRWSERYRCLPQPWSVGAFIETLEEIGVDALLPMASWMVRALVPVQSELAQVAAVNLPDPEAFAAADDGRRTHGLCAALGIPVPRLMPQDAVTFPAVVKPAIDVGAARGVSFCRREEELRPALERCRPFGEPMIQEFIPGGPDCMRTLVVLFDRQARLLAHFTTAKLWTRPIDGGITTLSVSTDDGGLVRQMLPFFEAVGWHGPAEVELKVDPRDGLAKVIEINPRFPGYVGFAVRCGIHLPRMAARAALGESVAAASYAVGRKYLNPMMHLKALADRLRQGPDRWWALAQASRQSWDAPWVGLADLSDPGARLAKVMADLRGSPADESTLIRP